MSIIDQTITCPDVIGQLTTSNCIPTFGCPSYYPYAPQPVTYNPKEVTIEAVEGGYIIRGKLGGNSSWRTVAISADGRAKLLKSWCGQFEAK